MLDTNMASYVINGKSVAARKRLATLPMDRIFVSVVTEAELLYGCARKGHPEVLAQVIKRFLLRVNVLPWDRKTAAVYADLRVSCNKSGVSLSALDMMIAAHAIASNSVLVTHDKAYRHVSDGALVIEDWLTD